MHSRAGACARAKLFPAVFVAAIFFAGGAAFACGYHNPSDVARGVMNFAYPKSLYVRTAVWQAQNSGLLPARPRRSVKDLFAYQRTAADLQTLARALGTGIEPGAGFTVVLLDAMLWTRYAAGEGAFDVSIHVKGPERGDVVVVTESAVVRALNGGSISFDRAESEGLIRLYGPEAQKETLRAVFRGQSQDKHSEDARSVLPDGAAEASG